jgi:hypothetical protein
MSESEQTCPKCGSELVSINAAERTAEWECGSDEYFDYFTRSPACLIREQAARIAELEGELVKVKEMLTDGYVASAELVPGVPTPMYGLATIQDRVSAINAALAPRGEGMEA